MQIFRKSAAVSVCVLVFTCRTLVAEALPADLGDWSPVVRAAASQRVARSGTAALPDLLMALGSDNTGLRHAAAEAVGLIAKKARPDASGDWREMTNKLVSVLNDDPDFWVRCGAAGALKAIHAEPAAPALIKAAGDSNPWVAAAAVDAISALPVKFFEPRQYLSTATRSLGAPRSETRVSALEMIGRLGPEGKPALPMVEASVGTYSQDSMFADRPRIDAIVWIARFDRRKAAALAGGLLKEERWGATGRYRKILPFLESLGPDAAPAAEGLRFVIARKVDKDKASATKAAKILSNLKTK